MRTYKTISELFSNKALVKKIKTRLPYLFQLAEIENSRNKKLGMEIGSTREQILIALCIYAFGIKNVETQFSINKKEVDAKIYKKNLSIKTITSKKPAGVKLIWTVDQKKAQEFKNNYKSVSDILFVQINWNNVGGVYLVKKEAQNKLLKEKGKNFYFKLPKEGTNPRGVEITKNAIKELLNKKSTQKILIDWKRFESDSYEPYKKWINLWKK